MSEEKVSKDPKSTHPSDPGKSVSEPLGKHPIRRKRKILKKKNVVSYEEATNHQLEEEDAINESKSGMA